VQSAFQPSICVTIQRCRVPFDLLRMKPIELHLDNLNNGGCVCVHVDGDVTLRWRKVLHEHHVAWPHFMRSAVTGIIDNMTPEDRGELAGRRLVPDSPWKI